jgi:hypothetical protein
LNVSVTGRLAAQLLKTRLGNENWAMNPINQDVAGVWRVFTFEMGGSNGEGQDEA